MPERIDVRALRLERLRSLIERYRERRDDAAAARPAGELDCCSVAPGEMPVDLVPN
jgi:hypothetical protein